MDCLIRQRILSSSQILFIYFLERGERRERERKRETSMCKRRLPLAHPQWRTWPACNPGTCPDQESNQQSFSSQASTQSTKPHQPGLGKEFLYVTSKVPSPKGKKNEKLISLVKIRNFYSSKDIIKRGENLDNCNSINNKI